MIRARHFRPRTAEARVGWIKRFVRFNILRHPYEMRTPGVNHFFSRLATREKVPASAQNQAMQALLFQYNQVLNLPLGQLGGIIRAKKPGRPSGRAHMR